jgi:hypothetical protein
MPNGKSRHNIYERIFNFIVSVLKFIDKLPKIYSNQVIIGQITSLKGLPAVSAAELH